MTETGQGRRARGAAGAGVFCWGFQSDFINEMGGCCGNGPGRKQKASMPYVS